MAKSRVRVIDRGWWASRKRLRELDGMTVLVGVQADAGVGADGTPIAEYASYNEFGTKHIPSRPAMRTGFDENVGEIMQATRSLKDAVVDRRMSADEAAGLLGELHQGHIKKKIASNMPPPNAPATVKAKGSSKTLIDQGNYLNAIKWKIERKAKGALRGIVSSIFGRRK